MKIRYQCVFFAELGHLGATSQNTLRILQRLQDVGLDLVPSTIPEVTPPLLVVEQRLSFNSADGTISINVGRTRLDIFQNALSFEGPDLPPMQQFISTAQHCLNCVLEGAGVLGTRLALTTLIAHPQIPSDEMDARFRALCIPPGSMGASPPHDWNIRIGLRADIGSTTAPGPVNVVMRTSRSQLQQVRMGAAERMERMTTEIDINTIPEDAEPRFQVGQATEFMTRAAARTAQIEADLLSIGIQP